MVTTTTPSRAKFVASYIEAMPVRLDPPWIHTITGALEASVGANTLSCRQSSDVGPEAPPGFGRPSGIIACGQAGPKRVASRTPDQADAACVGAQRRSPTGGAA